MSNRKQQRKRLVEEILNGVDTNGTNDIDTNNRELKKPTTKKIVKLPPFEHVKPTRPVRNYTLPDYEQKYRIDLNNYEYAMSEYNKKYLEWVKRAVEQEKDIPYEKRSKASLIRELEARELNSSGSR